MGNDTSKRAKVVHNKDVECNDQIKSSEVPELWITRFKMISNGAAILRIEDLTKRFGPDFGGCIWKYLLNDIDTEIITPLEFMRKATPLFGSSTDVYVKMIGDPARMLYLASQFDGSPASQQDHQFVLQIIDSIYLYGSDIDSWIKWKRAECPKICDSLQQYFISSFHSSSDVIPRPLSHVVTAFEMWFIGCRIAPCYVLPSIAFSSWSILYSSATSGLSSSRFQSSVFGYRGHTLTILRVNGVLYAIGCDVEWRNSANAFGGEDSFIMRLSPPFTTLHGPSALYCNLKLRTSPMGIFWKNLLKLDKDFCGVEAIEVWGCGDEDAIRQHKKQHEWREKQAERHRKVPLPGQWEADKTILEMAGFTFSNESRD